MNPDIMDEIQACEHLVSILRGYGLAMRHEGKDDVADLVDTVIFKMEYLIRDSEGQYWEAIAVKLYRWLLENVPNAEEFYQEIGLLESEQLGLSVSTVFQKYLETEENNNDNRENECTSGACRTEND